MIPPKIRKVGAQARKDIHDAGEIVGCNQILVSVKPEDVAYAFDFVNRETENAEVKITETIRVSLSSERY